VDEDLEEDLKYSWTRHYWEIGKLGTVYQSFLDANELIRKAILMRKLRRMKNLKSWKQDSLLLGQTVIKFLLGIGSIEMPES
jgi:hypothetical protein